MQPFRLFFKRVSFIFRYDATDYGSADLFIKCDEQKAEFRPTYVGINPLWSMLTILPDLVNGYDDHGIVHWSSEPGEMKLEINVKKGLAHFVVKEFDIAYDYKNEDGAHWITRIDAALPLSQIVQVITSEVERNIRLLGIVGLSESWDMNGDVFPINAYLQLKGVKPYVTQDTTRISSLDKEIRILKQL